MQPHLRNDMLYLLRILEAAEKIMLYTGAFSEAMEFYEYKDQLNFNASLNLLAQIGEQGNKISATLVQKHPQADWVQIRGMRNRIVHDYTGVDIYIVFETVKREIPELKSKISAVVKTELNEGNFDREEFDIAKTSPYLRHIDFPLFD